MSEKPETNKDEEWEMRVQETSRHFEFPKTPNIAKAVERQLYPRRPLLLRPALALLLMALFVSVLAVPPIRAALLDILRIGAANIIVLPEATPLPAPDLPLLQSGIPLSLEDAQATVDYPIPLPSELGNPSALYLQEIRLPMLVLVWYEPPTAAAAPVFLYIIDSRDQYFKLIPDEPEIVELNGQEAIWFEDPHLMEYVEASSRLVSHPVYGNVLVWHADGKTYRLEGELSLEEALRIVGSMP